MSHRTLAWSVWAASIVLVVAWVVVDRFVTGNESSVGEYAFVIGAVVLYGTVGALITSQQLGNRIGLIFAWVAFAAALGITAGSYAQLATQGALPFAAAATWVANIGVVAIIGPIAFLFLLYPTGRPPSPRWERLMRVMLLAYGITFVLFALTPGTMRAGFADFEGHVRNPIGLPLAWKDTVETVTSVFGFVLFLGALSSVVSLIQRYRHAEATERQQIRWLALLGAVIAAFIVVMFPLEAAGVFAEDGTATNVTFFVLITLLFLGVPITCGLAILKHGLWDLDVVVKKTVQYGVLVVALTAVLVVLFIAAPTLAIGVGGNPGVMPFFAGAVSTLLVLFARSRARRWADRIVYGRRATPYEVLSEFAERAGETYSTEDVLPRMAQLLGEAIGARVARVWLRIGNVMRAEASWPPDAAEAHDVRAEVNELPSFGDDRAFEVRHHGELLGALTVTEAPDDPITPAKEKLVRDMAAQGGLVLRNVRLIEDLRESRRRIVAAQDERAKQLERNIHDGVQQQLVALAVRLKLADASIDRDPEQAHDLLRDLHVQATATLEDLRDLARGIYPPLLADQGLRSALEAQARKSPVPVHVNGDGIGRYSQDVEAAVYFACLEAMNNVAKYAEASVVELDLAQRDGRLTFAVRDDGVGFDPTTAKRGTGLQGIVDRLDAVGGSVDVRSRPGAGTTIAASVPVD